jgi:trehalose 6-phosphate phosphatase
MKSHPHHPAQMSSITQSDKKGDDKKASSQKSHDEKEPDEKKTDGKQIGEKKTNTLTPEVRSQLEPFLETVARASEAILLLDYDGTLAPFKTKRNEAFPYPGVVLLLQEIVRSCRTRLVVITGREANEVLPLLNLYPRPEVWGIHGMQRMRIDGNTETKSLDQKTLDALSDADRWLQYQHLRELAEMKAGGVAVHWRGLSPSSIEDIRSRVLLGWSPIAERSGINLLEFDGGIEIRAREANKGNAVRTLVSETSPGTPLAYLGDDTTDESAFEAMNSRGISVLVRSTWRPTAAKFWLKPPGELLDFLNLWLQTCVEQYSRDRASAASKL